MRDMRGVSERQPFIVAGKCKLLALTGILQHGRELAGQLLALEVLGRDALVGRPPQRGRLGVGEVLVDVRLELCRRRLLLAGLGVGDARDGEEAGGVGHVDPGREGRVGRHAGHAVSDGGVHR